MTRLSLASNLFRDLGQARSFDRLHRGNRIDRRDLDSAVSVLLHDEIAGKHRADLVFEHKRAVRELRVARP